MAQFLQWTLHKKKEELMRLAKCLMAAAVLAAGIGTARADIYSVNIPFNFETEVGNTPLLQPVLFDGTKGVLKAVNLNFSGIAGGITTGVPANNPSSPFFSSTPKTLGFINSIGVLGDYFNYYKQFPETYGPTILQYTNNIYSVPSKFDFTISAPRISIRDYTNCSGCISEYVRGGTEDFNAATGTFYGPGGGSQDALFVAIGTMTETFTYDPRRHRHDVPEPGSLALLGTALAMLAGILSFV